MNKNPTGNCNKDIELLKDCSHIFCPDSRLCIFCELKNSYSYLQGVCKSHRPVTWHNGKNSQTEVGIWGRKEKKKIAGWCIFFTNTGWCISLCEYCQI